VDYEAFERLVRQAIEAVMNASALTYASIAVGLVFLVLSFKVMFRAPGSFRQSFTFRRSRLFDPEYLEHTWSELKIFLCLALAAAAGWAAHTNLPALFPDFFH
jgi:hypothetical protein